MDTKTIIYDDSCLLCSTYTNVFIYTGFINKGGRKSLSNISADLIEKIDLKRAVNEIPLIDTTTNDVWYGIDALLEILQQKIPFAKPVGSLKPIRWMLQKLYKIISYNRRVIVAGSNKPGSFDCKPDFNIKYRVTFLLIFLFVNSMLLFPLHELVLRNSLFQQTSVYKLQAAHATVVALNILIAARLGFKDGIEYLGQINMLALTILLLTVPLMVAAKYSVQSQVNINNFCFGMLSLFSLHEYTRRMRFIGLLKRHPKIVLINIVSFIFFLTCLF